jgi:hypothetical protein
MSSAATVFLLAPMYDWLAAIARWLEVNVIGLPIYLAAPAMIVIGALDSSLLSLPEINDYLVVGRCFKDPSAAFYFPLFAAIGSVIGCNLLYTIVRRGGQAVLRKRFNLQSIKRVERAYERFGFSRLAFPQYFLRRCLSRYSSLLPARSSIRAGSFY